MFWQAKHSHTSFAKRGTMQHFFPLRPAEFEAGHHMHMLSPTPRPNFENGALHAPIFSYTPVEFGSGAPHSNIFSYAPVEYLEARRYMLISSLTPRLDLGRGTICKIYHLRPDAV